jgi:membrane-associated phospholipid phosphatase
MTIFFRPFFAASLALIFILSALAGGPASGLETVLMEHMAVARANLPQLTRLAAVLTQFGSAPITLSVAGGGSLWLLLNRAPGRALLLVGSVVVERMLVDGLKEWIGRPRPHLEILPQSLAFPSGHSANSMTAFVATALLACPPRYRRGAVAAALALTLIVGLTRVFLGVHWPSDVVGGWSFGLLAITAALTAGQRSGVLSLKAQHEIVGGHRLPPGEDEAA